MSMHYQTEIATLEDFYRTIYAIPARKTRTIATPKAVTKRLLQALDNPHKELSSVLVTGSKGKGSSAIMLANLIQSAGYKVGQFCSPHLFDFRERITVNGQMIAPEQLLDLARQVFAAANQLSINHPDEFPRFFEVTTAIAYLHFVRNYVDYAVIETGIGALTDATNQDAHQLSILTNVEAEHLDVFGDISGVANEKAGVIQPNTPLILGDLPESIDQMIIARAAELNAPVTRFKREYIVNNSGFFAVKVGKETWIADSVAKAKNAWTALAAFKQLNIDLTDTEKVTALQDVYLPAREEIVSKTPFVIIDGAHTRDSAHSLGNYVAKSVTTTVRKKILLLSFSAEKNIAPILAAFPDVDKIVLTQATTSRSLSPQAILAEIQDKHLCNKDIKIKLCENPLIALKKTMKKMQAEDVLIITGSVYLAGLLSQQFRL